MAEKIGRSERTVQLAIQTVKALDPDTIRLIRGTPLANNQSKLQDLGRERIEFAKVEGSHGSAVFGELIRYCDACISKIIVGQTMTADDGSSQSQATVHNEVRLDILRADGKATGRTVSRDVIRPFVAFNFGPQPVYPRVAFPVAEPDDIAALTAALVGLVPLGLKVSSGEIRGKLGLSEPEDDDELLTAPKPPPALPPRTRRPAPARGRGRSRRRGRPRRSRPRGSPPTWRGAGAARA